MESAPTTAFSQTAQKIHFARKSKEVRTASQSATQSHARTNAPAATALVSGIKENAVTFARLAQ